MIIRPSLNFSCRQTGFSQETGRLTCYILPKWVFGSISNNVFFFSLISSLLLMVPIFLHTAVLHWKTRLPKSTQLFGQSRSSPSNRTRCEYQYSFHKDLFLLLSVSCLENFINLLLFFSPRVRMLTLKYGTCSQSTAAIDDNRDWWW